MRTTLTISDEIDSRLRRVAREQNRPYREVVNEALLRGLDQVEVHEPPSEYHVRSAHYGFRAGVDRGKLNQLFDEIEAGG